MEAFVWQRQNRKVTMADIVAFPTPNSLSQDLLWLESCRSQERRGDEPKYMAAASFVYCLHRPTEIFFLLPFLPPSLSPQVVGSAVQTFSPSSRPPRP